MKLSDIMPLLEKIRGATFASMDTRTSVKLTGGKKNPMKDRVWKVCKNHRVMIFTNQNSNAYQNMVRRRLEKEGKTINFDVAPRAWGTRIPNTPIIEHNGKYYLDVIFLAPGSIEYFLDDEQISEGSIEGMPIKSVESGRQGLEPNNKVVVRTFSLDSIETIRLMKEEIS